MLLTGTDSILSQKFYLLEDIDVNKIVSVERTGQLDDLPGVNIDFPSLSLNIHDRTFNSDFVREMQIRYFVKELDEDFVNSIEVLELDYDLSTLEEFTLFPESEKGDIGEKPLLVSGICERRTPEYLDGYDEESIRLGSAS